MFTHLRTCFSGKDNVSLDLGRILWAVVVLWFLVLSTYVIVVNHQTLDYVLWSASVVTLMGGGAGSLLLKSKTEPDPPS